MSESKPPLSTWAHARKSGERKQRKRSLRWVALGLLAIVALLVVFAPAIAGIAAPGIIAGQSQAMKGSLAVDRTSFSWFQMQQVKGLRFTDAAGDEVANLDLRVDDSLIDLITSGGRLTKARLSGSLSIARDADGNLNAAEAASPTTPSPAKAPASSPAAFPEQIRGATLAIDNLRITYADAAFAKPAKGTGVERTTIDALNGSISISDAGDITVDLKSPIDYRPTAATNNTDAGTLTIDATITNLVASDGSIDTAAAKVDGSITAAAIALDLLVAMGIIEQPVADALGRTAAAGITADGSLDVINLTATARSDALRLNAPITYDAKAARITAAAPITIDITGASLAPLAAPSDSYAVTTWPDVSLTLPTLSLPLPAGDAIDLRDLAVALNARISPAAGTVTVPGTTQARAIGFSEIALDITTDALRNGIVLTSTADIRIDNAPGGALNANFTASDLLDETGAPRAATLPTIAGELTATDIALRALQPILDAIGGATGVDLARDLGEIATITVTAAPAASGEPGVTDVALNAVAQHARATANAAITSTSVRLTGDGINASLDRAGPILAAMTRPAPGEQAPLRIDAAGPISLAVPAASINLEQLAAGDLRTVAAAASISVGRITGALTTPDAPARAFTLRDIKAAADAPTLAETITLTASAAAEIDGASAGSLNANLTAAGLLDAAGAMRQGLPAELSGTANIANLDTALLQPFLAASGLDARRDLGQTLTITLDAKATPNTANADLPPTDLRLRVTGDRIAIDAPLIADATRLRSGPTPITIEHRAVSGLIAAFMPKGESAPAIAFDNGGRLLLTVQGLDVPLNDGAPDITAAAANANASITGIGLTANGRRITLSDITSGFVLAPNADPSMTLAVTGQADAPFSINGNATAVNALREGAPLKLKSTFQASAIPAALADLVSAPLTTPSGQRVSIHELARTIGVATIDTTLNTAPTDGPGTLIDIVMRAPALQANARGTVPLSDPTAAGDWAANAVATLEPAALDRIMGWYAPNASPAPRLARAAALNLSLAQSGPNITAKLEAPAIAFQPVTLPAQPGSPAQTFGPFTLAATMNASGPAATLLDKQTGNLAFDTSIRATDAQQQPLGTITANGTAGLAAGGLAGNTKIQTRVEGFNTAVLDTLAGQAGLASGALGSTITLNANADATLDAEGKATAATARVEIASQRLRTTAPIDLRMQDGALSLTQPSSLAWDVDPAWMGRFLKPSTNARAVPQLAEVRGVALDLEKLRLPLQPGAPFDFGAAIKAAAIAFRMADGTPLRYDNLYISARRQEPSGAIALLGELDGPGGSQALRMNGLIEDVLAADGSMNPAAATITLDASVNDLPTVLIEALAGLNADLPGLLGDTASASVKMNRFPRDRGTITLNATSPNTSAELNAAVEQRAGKRFIVASGRPAVRVKEFGQNFKYDLFGALPMISGGLKKDPNGQDPTEAAFSRLVLPVPEEWDLNAVDFAATIDPGQARFELAGPFTSLLKAAGLRQEGEAGRRLEAFSTRMKDGVLTIERFKLPVGEFVFTADGTMDFNRNYREFNINIPVGAVASDQIPGLSQVLSGGGLLKEGFPIPIKASGTLDGELKYGLGRINPLEMVDPGKALEQTIKKGLGDLIPKNLPGFPGGGGGGGG